jgi:serine/threonine protein kinase
MINKFLLMQLKSNYACRLPSVGWILGITQDPNTNEYVMVMRYYEEGDFRQFLKRNASLLTWKEKLNVLRGVAGALNDIHKAGLLHRDLHPGNIYQRYNSRYKIYVSYLGDLGLCSPANEPPASKLYGVMPYVAPEVLQNEPYTCESEIYSFGITMSELASGKPPFANEAHKSDLVLKICYGEYRPEFPHKTPKCYVELMKQCWDKNPSKRPTAEIVYDKISEWDDSYESGGEIFEIFKRADEEHSKEITQETSKLQPSSDIHPEAVYTSRLLSNFIISG